MALFKSQCFPVTQRIPHLLSIMGGHGFEFKIIIIIIITIIIIIIIMIIIIIVIIIITIITIIYN